MPTLDWIGKDKVVNHHMDVPYRVLERVYSYEKSPDPKDHIISATRNLIDGEQLDRVYSILGEL